jgi:hypothetical protein
MMGACGADDDVGVVLWPAFKKLRFQMIVHSAIKANAAEPLESRGFPDSPAEPICSCSSPFPSSHRSVGAPEDREMDVPRLVCPGALTGRSSLQAFTTTARRRNRPSVFFGYCR